MIHFRVIVWLSMLCLCMSACVHVRRGKDKEQEEPSLYPFPVIIWHVYTQTSSYLFPAPSGCYGQDSFLMHVNVTIDQDSDLFEIELQGDHDYASTITVVIVLVDVFQLRTNS